MDKERFLKSLCFIGLVQSTQDSEVRREMLKPSDDKQVVRLRCAMLGYVCIKQFIHATIRPLQEQPAFNSY